MGLKMAELRFRKDKFRNYIEIEDADKTELIEIPSPRSTSILPEDKAKLAYDKIHAAYKKNPSLQNKRQLELMWFLLEQDKLEGKIDRHAIAETKKAGSVWHKIAKVFKIALEAWGDNVEQSMGALDIYWGELLLEPEKGLAIAGFKANYNAQLDAWYKAKDFQYKDSRTFTDPFKSYPARLAMCLFSKKTYAEWKRLEKIYTPIRGKLGILPEPEVVFRMRQRASFYQDIVLLKTLRFAHRLAKSDYGKQWADKNKDSIQWQYRFWNDPLWLVGIASTKLIKGIPFVRQALKAIDPTFYAKAVKYVKPAKAAAKFPVAAKKVNQILNWKPLQKTIKFFTRVVPPEAKIQQLPTGNKLMKNISEMMVLKKGNFLLKKKEITKMFKHFSIKEKNFIMNALDNLDIITKETGKVKPKDYAKLITKYGKKVADGAVKARKITLEGWKPGTPFRKAYWSHKYTPDGEIIQHFKKVSEGRWQKGRAKGLTEAERDLDKGLTWIRTREKSNEILKRASKQVDKVIDDLANEVVIAPFKHGKKIYKKGTIEKVLPAGQVDAITDLQELKDFLVYPLRDIAKTPFAKIPRGDKIVEKIIPKVRKHFKEAPTTKIVIKKIANVI